MNVHENPMRSTAEMMALGQAARDAARAVREADDATKTKALRAAAAAMRARKGEILAANARDIEAAKAGGMAAAMVDRLTLNDARIEAMAKGVEEVAAQADPNGRELARWTRPNGLDIARVATPIGVIGIIYESRPNVTADAGAIALKAGNVAILRGGSDSLYSAGAIHAAMVEGLKAAGLPEAAIQYVKNTDRAAVGLMLEGLNGAIDLIIPRGGKGLTGRVMREARVPVLAHLEGLCHTYVHAQSDAEMARKIVLNAKMRRTVDLRRHRNFADRPRRAAKAMACPSWKIWPRPAAKSAATMRCARSFPPPKPPPKKTGRRNIWMPSSPCGWWTIWTRPSPILSIMARITPIPSSPTMKRRRRNS